MRFEQLRCLADIAKTGSINKTAQRLFISQQAVSKSIKQLEKEFEIELLVRSKSGAFLTEAGKEFVRFAEKVLAEEDVLKVKIHNIRNIGSNNTKINVISASALVNLAIPSIISKLNAQSRQTQIHLIQSSDYNHVLQMVFDGVCDIGLLSINEQLFHKLIELYAPLLETELLLRDELVVVMDRRYYNGQDICIDGGMFTMAKAKTIYNLTPVEIFQNMIQIDNVTCSDDADFHRGMMDKAEAMTMMTRWTYQHYFNTKRYVALDFCDSSYIPQLHMVVYRKDAKQEVHDIIAMMRREMHIK